MAIYKRWCVRFKSPTLSLIYNACICWHSPNWIRHSVRYIAVDWLSIFYKFNIFLAHSLTVDVDRRICNPPMFHLLGDVKRLRLLGYPTCKVLTFAFHHFINDKMGTESQRLLSIFDSYNSRHVHWIEILLHLACLFDFFEMISCE